VELIYQKKLEILPIHTNEDGKLTLSSLLDFLQKIAGEHADRLKFGVSNLNEANDTWVLSRLRVEVDKWPQKGETVVLKTWPKGIDRLFAVRDFHLYDREGNVIARAASYWLVIDRQSKRPKMMANVFKNLDYPGLSAIDQKLGKIPESYHLDYHSQIISEEKEIDVNGHVNNVWYANWIMSTLPEDLIKEKSITSFEINYLSEVFADELVDVELGWSDDDKNLMLGSLKRNDKEVCRVKLLFD
jgi:acyl-ACP thioesterase